MAVGFSGGLKLKTSSDVYGGLKGLRAVLLGFCRFENSYVPVSYQACFYTFRHAAELKRLQNLF